MFRSTLVAAFRSLTRNGLYAGVGIVGLALGLAAAILTALYGHDETHFDSFIPGHEHVYVVTSTLRAPGTEPVTSDYAPGWIAGRLKQAFPQIHSVARLAYDRVSVRRGGVEAQEAVAWVDPVFFDILPLPALAGDPRRALEDPDVVVITESLARKYFGRSAPLGEVLQFDGAHDLRVGAVIRDLPAESHLGQGIFASGKASFSEITRMTATGLEEHGAQGGFYDSVATQLPGQFPPWRFHYVRTRLYLRIDDAVAAQAVAAGLGDFARRLGPLGDQLPKTRFDFDLSPLSDLHLQTFKGANLGVGEVHGSRDAVDGLALCALLVLALSAINFVNLATARAGRRAVEVGMRKVAGAERWRLIAQFIGEAWVQAALAMLVALALVELLLPVLNAFLGRRMAFAYWREPSVILALVATTLVIGGLAGAYPALVLSAFRPAAVLKGGRVQAGGSGLVRQGLVVFQFVVLTVLILAVLVVWRQTAFAMGDGLRLDKDQVLVVHVTPCQSAFEAEVRRLPGVRAAACSSSSMLGLDEFNLTKVVFGANLPGGPLVPTDMGLVDFGLLELYGVRPLAGRLFSRDHAGDAWPPLTEGVVWRGSVVLNESAVRALRFASDQQAVGHRLFLGADHSGDSVVIGVVPDFTLDLLNAAIRPTIFSNDFANYPGEHVLSIKLDGRRIPETLAGIDGLWRKAGQPGAIRRQFLDDYVQALYVGTLRQGFLVSVLCGLALFLACLGLLGLAAFTAERRTKEIGVRKALGASTADILGLLTWQFTQPVLIASLIAAPIGWWIMRGWLDRFAYRIDLAAWMFLAAGLATLLIAWVTVGAHAWTIARRQPVEALRHE